MSYPNPSLNITKPIEGNGIVEAEIFVSELPQYDQLVEFARVNAFNSALYRASNKVSNIMESLAILGMMEKPRTESVMRCLPFEYIETVNGLEVFVEDPKIKNATSLVEDVMEPLKNDLKSQGVQFKTLIVNFY